MRGRSAATSNYQKFQDWFTELQPYFLKERFVVKNCNPTSKLTAFPFMPYEDAVAEATAHLGDYRHERTWGCTQTRGEARGDWQAPGAKPSKDSGASMTARRSPRSRQEQGLENPPTPNVSC